MDITYVISNAGDAAASYYGYINLNPTISNGDRKKISRKKRERRELLPPPSIRAQLRSMPYLGCGISGRIERMFVPMPSVEKLETLWLSVWQFPVKLRPVKTSQTPTLAFLVAFSFVKYGLQRLTLYLSVDIVRSDRHSVVVQNGDELFRSPGRYCPRF